ncbi:MAG: hypothetical protein K0S99_369, partial [Thermomicrobiales bacterium]|nr:hypothetical protein [Thermomicrobiales bacterium]
MRLAEGDTAFRQRIIDFYSSREGVESRRDLVGEIVVGRRDASDHSERLELAFRLG